MKWEYLIIRVHEDLEKREFAFNNLGSEHNYELVAVDNGVAYFKRSMLGVKLETFNKLSWEPVESND